MCRQNKGSIEPLVIGTVVKECDEGIEEGILLCSSQACLSEFPIIDGIPIIVPNLRAYVSGNTHAILKRNDLSDTMESLIGDCCGPGSEFDTQRQHLSIYNQAHFSDLQAASEGTDLLPGNAKSAMKTLVDSTTSNLAIPNGPILDIGCATGRGTFEWTQKTNDLVLGIDLNFSFLRTANKALTQGFISYPKRRCGLVYDYHKIDLGGFSETSKADFWACDALNLPFCDNQFDLATSYNIIDTTQSPFDCIQQMHRVLKPDGLAILTTPYDWTGHVTPVTSWIGGHSQRCTSGGDPEKRLRELLCQQQDYQFTILEEGTGQPWTLHLHDRCLTQYLVHWFRLQKKAVTDDCSSTGN